MTAHPSHPPRKVHSVDAGTHDRFWPHYRRALPVVILITALMVAAEHAGLMDRAATTWLDTLVLGTQQRVSRDVVIVQITEDDYRSHFASTSPLDARPLAVLIEALIAGSPKVIAIDLDTSSGAYESLIPIAARPPAPDRPILLWAAIPKTAGRVHLSEPFELNPPLGGLGPDHLRVGVPVFPIDSDGVVRAYHRTFRVHPAGRANSLSLSVVEAYRHEAHHDEDEHFGRFIGARHEFPIVRAGEIIDAPQKAAATSLLAGKIVVIGGGYGAARDEYATPLGPMSGVQLVAQAIESELQGTGLSHVSHTILIVCDLVAGSLLVVLHYFLRPRLALMVGLAAMPAVAITASLVAFRALAYWASFIPILAGTILHQLHESSVHKRHMRAALAAAVDEKQSRVVDLKGDLSLAHAEIEALQRRVNRLRRWLASAKDALRKAERNRRSDTPPGSPSNPPG